MSGHSKWKTNKGKKSIADAKRGATFTKIIKELVVVSRDGGGNPDTNPRLRAIIAKAREANMPMDNVKTAIKRGTGELPGVIYENVNYESYGPGGVALLIEALTDNKNRTTAELRNIMNKRGGSMAGAGSVSWMFVKKGYFAIEKDAVKEDDLMPLLDHGVEDIKTEDPKQYELFTVPQDFEKAKAAIDAKGIKCLDAEITMLPSSAVKVVGNEAKQVLALIDALEEHDDVEAVYANFDIPDEIMEQIANSQGE